MPPSVSKGSRYLLLYNDECGLCRALAALLHAYSNHRIKLVPLSSEKAAELLRGHASIIHRRTYFLIEENARRHKIHKGIRAAARLPRIIGIRASPEPPTHMPDT